MISTIWRAIAGRFRRKTAIAQSDPLRPVETESSGLSSQSTTVLGKARKPWTSGTPLGRQHDDREPFDLLGEDW